MSYKKYKVISFDLWETLVYSNPEYKRLRTEYIQSVCPNLTLDDINTICRIVKRDLDSSVEEHGLSFTSEESLSILATKLAGNRIDKTEFIYNIKKIFLDNLPLLYPETLDTLKTLSEQGYILCLSSNTLFIDNITITRALFKLGITKYFDASVFSDELGYSKPHINFFKEIQIKTSSLKYEILHVGDNKKTDVQGALNYGINYFHIDKTNTESETLINNILNA